MDKILQIKLFGESIRFLHVDIPIEYQRRFHDVSKCLNEPLNLAILNNQFYNKLAIPNIISLENISNPILQGLLNNYKNRIEITYGRRKVFKANLNSIINQQTLFPLYQVQYNLFNLNNLTCDIYVIEKEIGLIGVLELNTTNLDIDLLKFQITKLELKNFSHDVLSKITYNNKVLHNIKTDALLTYQSGFKLLTGLELAELK